MSIEKQTTSILSKAIKRYATLNDVSVKDSQLMICTDNPDCTPSYKVLKHYKEVKSVTFNEILDVKLDFLGREILATPFIRSSIKRLTQEANCSYDEASVLIYPIDEVGEKIRLHFFVGTKPNKEISMEYIFGDM